MGCPLRPVAFETLASLLKARRVGWQESCLSWWARNERSKQSKPDGFRRVMAMVGGQWLHQSWNDHETDRKPHRAPKPLGRTV